MNPRHPSWLAWLVVSIFPALSAQQSPATSDWDSLKTGVGGRLFPGVPYATPCFTQDFNSTACLAAQAGYVDEVALSNSPGGYIQSQWGSCQKTGDQCLLNFANPHDITPTLPPSQCKIGSVPGYFIDVRQPQDVAAAFKFSKEHGVPLVIKNTGHDYKGRSSAPNSLALWTHNLKNISMTPGFIPEGCSNASPGPGVTIGAGVQWSEAYAFAEAHNITVVGGSDRSVGVAGGWLQGGGHSALSPSMGLGVDRVLQFKVVTPDGMYRTANECQNQDLFWALRGGGGGTFGVVLEATILASPQVTLQAAIVAFTPNATLNGEMWTILAENGLKWAEEGWGGFSTSGTVILVNPKLTADAAAKSMAPLIQFGQRLKNETVPGAQAVLTTFPSWGSFFTAFVSEHVASVGYSLALASRLIPKDNFNSAANQTALVSALLAADAATPGLIILISGPAFVPYNQTATSVTDAWRSSIYHITVVSAWNWNATMAEKQGHYKAVSDSIDHLRKITPDGAYVNEADVYEPNHEFAFWGQHYDYLLQLKQKYDPDHLLDCWHCVGTKPDASRFSCYL